MIAGNIETVAGHYRGAELTQDVHCTDQGVPGHNQFGMVLYSISPIVYAQPLFSILVPTGIIVKPWLSI
jgi:hypothetical protein